MALPALDKNFDSLVIQENLISGQARFSLVDDGHDSEQHGVFGHFP